MGEKTYKIKDAAKESGIPAETIRTWLKRDRYPKIKIEDGSRLVSGVTDITLEKMIAEYSGGSLKPSQASAYEFFIKEWEDEQRSGFHNGKPMEEKSIENNRVALKNYWKYLNYKNVVQEYDQVVQNITAENLRLAISNVSRHHLDRECICYRKFDKEKRFEQPDTRNCHFAIKDHMYKAVMSFLRYLIRKGLKREPIILEIQKYKPERKTPERKTLVTPEELQKLFKINDALDEGRMDLDSEITKVLIGLMAYAGLRRSEVINLEIKDIDLSSQELYVVKGKGCKNRKIGLCVELVDIITDWLNVRPVSTYENFLLQKEGLPITKQVINGRIRRIAKQAKVEITPHGLRVTFATMLAAAGVPVDQIQILLGHSKIETTMGYIMTAQQTAVNSVKGITFGSGKQYLKDEQPVETQEKPQEKRVSLIDKYEKIMGKPL